jgi:hypothetical protein
MELNRVIQVDGSYLPEWKAISIPMNTFEARDTKKFLTLRDTTYEHGSVLRLFTF